MKVTNTYDYIQPADITSDEKCTKSDDDDTVFNFVDEKCIYILYSAAGTAEGQGDSGRGRRVFTNEHPPLVGHQPPDLVIL